MARALHREFFLALSQVLNEHRSPFGRFSIAWLARDREASGFSNLNIHFGFMRLNTV